MMDTSTGLIVITMHSVQHRLVTSSPVHLVQHGIDRGSVRLHAQRLQGSGQL